MADARRLLTITVLGSTQTVAWASSYYLPAILADDIARDTGTSTTWLYASFSVSLIISALLGPRAGRLIDRGSGNAVLAVSNLLFAGGLCLLALAQSLLVLQLAWLVLGIGMGIGLYDAAFAVLGRIYGTSARGAITGITCSPASPAPSAGRSRHGAQRRSAGATPASPGRRCISSSPCR
jgi:MFS family permease